MPVKSTGSVFPYVGVACLGAILFGYHLGYVLLSCVMNAGIWNTSLGSYTDIHISLFIWFCFIS